MLKYQIKKHVLWKMVDNEIVIVDPRQDSYSYLNQTGSEIWGMIDKKYSVEKMLETLCSEYDQTESKIRGDLDRIINDLVKSGLIEKAG